MLQLVPETINFAKEEEKVLLLWKEIDAFQTCLKQSKGRPRYTFYDGPPFATGLPHYGNLLAGTIKDIVTRFAHQSGFHVERRFGWDCHGLPVEYEIDKTLGITGPDDVMKMGIDKYNAECRKIVMRYAGEWERIVTRLGRWIDFDNDYKTLYPWFMESVWWVFKQMFNKGLVYKGFKVMPFSTACNTPLSNFESGQNYKEVVDPAVIVSFPLDEDNDVSMIAWTTTPWTLPSNMALCVNPTMEYCRVKDNSNGKVYIMMKSRLVALFKDEEEYTIQETFKGDTLKGKTYVPLFPYYAHLKSAGAFQVLVDDYVTDESGTGLVHQAPYFGADDYRVCLAAGVITKEQDIICPVDMSGCFTQPVVDFQGQYVKDADKNIIKMLKEEGRMVHSGSTKHSYPFCWRSETPLIYRAVPSWFIRVEQMSQQLLQNNQQTYWVPDFVKEKRFGNWLREARDWAVSRNRYWGTPIPLWVSEDMEEIVCIGSIEELQKLSGVIIKDLHREYVDDVTIPSSRPGYPPLKRVNEVFDCWFESGSMPYAQVHYPFENKREFEENFPADFIAEGIDQTRGWFYTLLVVGTCLFNKAPFKNLIANGLVLAADGQKMSKRKQNYPDPIEVVNKYGADALRLYLINSPVVRAENLRFKEDGVCDILKDVFLPWYNAYRFFVQNVERIIREDKVDFVYDESKVVISTNTMDRWIMSFTQSLLLFVKQEMAAYRLYTVVPRLVKFIDNLTNWYVRMNRKRLKGEGGIEDCRQALETLCCVLVTLTSMMASFTPFLTETMYQNLKHLLKSSGNTSVHFQLLPQPWKQVIDEKIEKAVSLVQSVIDLGRILRDRKTIPLKYPLPEIVVIHKDQNCLNDINSIQQYIFEELNVRKVTLTTDKQKYGVTLHAEPDHKTLGARLKGAFKIVTPAIKSLSDEEIGGFLSSGSIEVAGHMLYPEDLRIMYEFSGDMAEELARKYEAHSDSNLLVLLDVTPDQNMLEEGIAKEVINRIQKLRKKGHLVPSDEITVYYNITPPDSELDQITKRHVDFIQSIIKAPLFSLDCKEEQDEFIIEEIHQVKGSQLKLLLVRGSKDYQTSTPDVSTTNNKPYCRYVNVKIQGLQPRFGVKGEIGTVLLNNPLGEQINQEQLKDEIVKLFGLEGLHIDLCLSDGSEAIVKGLHGETIVVVPKLNNKPLLNISKSNGQPAAKFANVEYNGAKGTILLENPVGDNFSSSEILDCICTMFQLKKDNLQLLTDSLPVTLSLLHTLSNGTTLKVVETTS